MKISIKNLLEGILILVLGTVTQVSQGAEMLTEWYTYPSCDWRNPANPLKVTQLCPTERFVYVVMHGNTYDKTISSDWGLTKNAYLNLFVYDTKNEVAGFQPVQSIFPESTGLRISCINYNREKKYLVVAYQDGRIEMLYDNGKVIEISDFKDAKVPGDKWINSISFSPANNEAYLATKNGYVVIDDNTGILREWVKLWTPINYISRVGNELVGIMKVSTVLSDGTSSTEVEETTLASYDLSQGSPKKLSDFKPVEISDPSGVQNVMLNGKTGHLLISDGVLPLTDNTFLTVGRKGSSNAQAYSVISFTRQDDGSYRPLTLVDQFCTGVDGRYIVTAERLAGMNVTKEGYCFKGQNFALVKEGIDPDFTVSDPLSDYKSKVLTPVGFSKSGMTNALGASYDGKEFWSFLTCGTNDINGGFQLYEKDGSGVLQLKKDKLIPSGPFGIFGSSLAYAPGYGMIVPGREFNKYFASAGTVADYSSLFDGSNWKPISVAAVAPALTGMWNGCQGNVVDPDNPRYVYSGSYQNALLRKDLENPGNLLHITFGASYNAARGCDVEIIPNYSTNTGHTRTWIGIPSFDHEGRMWCAGFNSNTYKTKDGLPLFYWEREDRIASKDKASFKPFKSMKIKGITHRNVGSFAALKSPRGKNILVYGNGDWSSELTLCDHRGTLDNQNDDIIVTVDRGFDELGRIMNWDYIYGFREDPYDGRVWVFTGSGLYWFYPDEFLKTPGLMHRTVLKRMEGENSEMLFGESTMPFSMIVDSYNRKWFSFNGGGIVCLSEDNTEQLAHFDTSNSPLVSDVVFGLGWDPARNSLMISTEYGIQEMKILEGPAAHSRQVNIYPVSIAPGYKGNISISGVADSDAFVVLDPSGNLISELGNPSGGRIQWDLNNKIGQRVAKGKYTLFNKTASKNTGEVIVVE